MIYIEYLQYTWSTGLMDNLLMTFTDSLYIVVIQYMIDRYYIYLILRVNIWLMIERTEKVLDLKILVVR